MTSKTSAHDFLADRMNLAALKRAAEHCRGCDLYKKATQTVFGTGLVRALAMVVGEMPGDEEDQQGKPFVGAAGRLLQEAMHEAGIPPDDAYITNTVKHFRWEPRGKRRLHKKPSSRQIEACKPWLQAELLVIEPSIIVCLGATAAQSFLGRDFRVTRQRGTFVDTDWAPLMATYHPAAILRAPNDSDRRQKRREFVDDLRLVARHLNPQASQGTS